MRPDGSTAYITGGASGIGLAVAQALVGRGWNVAICGRDEGKLNAATLELARAAQSASSRPVASSGRVFAASADVSRVGDVRRWIGGALERLGPPDLLVNNAGIYVRGRISALTEDDWERVLDVNLKSAFLCTRELLPHLRERAATSEHGAWVISVASLAGKQGMAGSSAYSASKFGMVGFTESLLKEELKNGIRATVICPGYVATPLVAGAEVPPTEMIQPADVAATVLYLVNLSPRVVVREVILERSGAI